MKTNLCLSSVISSLLTGVSKPSYTFGSEAALKFIELISPLRVPCFLREKSPPTLAILYYVFNRSSAISTLLTLCPRSLISTHFATSIQSTRECSSMF